MRAVICLMAVVLAVEARGEEIRLYAGGGPVYLFHGDVATLNVILDDPPADDWWHGSAPRLPRPVEKFRISIFEPDPVLWSAGQYTATIPLTAEAEELFHHHGRVQTYIHRFGSNGGSFATFPWAEEGVQPTSHYGEPWGNDETLGLGTVDALQGNVTLPDQWVVTAVEWTAFNADAGAADVLAVLLVTVIPEPATGGMLAVGLLALAAYRPQKRQ